MVSSQPTDQKRVIASEPSMDWVNDEDLLPLETLQRLSEPARRLYRNCFVWMLRKGHTQIHLSEEAAAAMAGCRLASLADVRTELLCWALLDYRQTHKHPRYTLLSP